MKFAFLVYPKMQLMDLIGPLEILNIFQQLEPMLEISYVAVNLDKIDCGSGFVLSPDYCVDDAPQFDYLCVPGGKGRLSESNNANLINFIQKQYNSCKLMMSVCTGMFFLYKAGILKNHSVTTYWRALPEIIGDDSVTVVEERIVKSGNIWTSGGVSSGIDLMLEFINEIAGKSLAGQVQLMFEYFPTHTLYSSASDVHCLPLYPTETSDSNRKLPSYIQRFFANAEPTKLP